MFFTLKFIFRKANKTGGGPKPDVDFPEPDPEIFRCFTSKFRSYNIFLKMFPGLILGLTTSLVLTL